MEDKLIDKWVIKSPKQENGLWGMPMDCVKIDKEFFLHSENELKRSAFLIAFSESHLFCRSFEVIWSDSNGFSIIANGKFYKLNYADYELKENILTHIKNAN